MQIFVDLDTRKLRRSVSNSSPVTTLDFKRGDTELMEIFYVQNNAQVQLAAGAVISFGAKIKDAYDGAALVFEDDFTLSGSGATAKYSANPSFNTVPLDDALMVDDNPANDLKLLDLMGEITWNDDGVITSSVTFAVRVNNDVLRGDEGTPSSLPDPADWMPAALTFAGANPNDSVDGLTISGIVTPSAANGFYTEGVEVNGYPSYARAGYKIFRTTISYTWMLTTDTVPFATNKFVTTQNVATPDLVTEWTPISGNEGELDISLVASLTGTHLGQLCKASAAWWRWNGTAWIEEIADASLTIAKTSGLQAALNDKVDDSQLSISGGASKVLQYDPNGDLRFSGSAPTGDALTIGGVFMQDLERLWFLNTARSDGGSIFYYTAHDVNGGELQVNSANRIALCTGENGAIQLGLSRSANSKQYTYLQRRGAATSSIQQVSSSPLYFSASYWTGSAAAEPDNPGFVAVPTGTGTNSDLIVFNPGTQPSGNGSDGARTEVGRWAKTGLRLAVQDITNTDAAMTRAFADGRYKSVHSFLSDDHAGVTSSITPVDSGLAITLVSGVSYEIEMQLSWTHSAAGGVRFQGSNVGVLSVLGGIMDRTVGGSPVRATFNATNGLDGIVSAYVNAGGSITGNIMRGIFTATTGGLIKIQYAQSVSDATATVLKKGSYIVAHPL